MILDVTTHSSVYNTVGPQAQWYAHRWGKRDYPELHLDPAKIPPNNLYHLACFYGDTAEWKYLDDFLCKTVATIFIDSYGMFKSSTLELLQQCNIGFIKIPVDGWDTAMGKVHLGQDIESVKHSAYLLANKNVQLEYHLYQHNQEDVFEFKKFCKENNIPHTIVPGILNDDGISCIISENSKWLYDVYPAVDNSKHIALNKTTLGAQRLKTYIKAPQGRSILHKPNIPNLSMIDIPEDLKQRYAPSSETFIASSGHCFNNVELGQMFCMLMCSDWQFSVLDIKNMDDYKLSIVYAGSLLTSMDLHS